MISMPLTSILYFCSLDFILWKKSLHNKYTEPSVRKLTKLNVLQDLKKIPLNDIVITIYILFYFHNQNTNHKIPTYLVNTNLGVKHLDGSYKANLLLKSDSKKITYRKVKNLCTKFNKAKFHSVFGNKNSDT